MKAKFFDKLSTISILLLISGCQEERSIQPQTIQSELDTVITVTPPFKDTIAIDTLSTTPVQRVLRKTTTIRKAVKKVVHPAVEVDVDVHPPDPFEDTDYIGTPCGDYVDGICTRHAQCRKIEKYINRQL